ncbi:fluoride efflux transporter CrcB [Pseudomonadales bacterium]|nr:fluoride efflux transporter CrcB [Pseudomonadales bacterium]
MHALQGSHMQTSLSISVLLMVAVGGSLGAVLRYLVTLWSIQKFGDGFPWGTLLVNIVGAFFVGLMIALLQERTLLNPYWRPLVVVGALGSLTTFSMFSVEMLQFIERGNWALALAYMLSSVIICVALVAFGLQLGKLI